MIPRDVFYDRRDNHCRPCEFWKGACLKGHSLSSPEGCPIQKFPPINGAAYAPDRTAKVAAAVPTPGNCCGGTDPDLNKMSWTQATTHLATSVAKWAREGFETSSDEVYDERVKDCQDGCPHYKWFQCKLCKCVVFTKAMIPHETCPAKRWKR